jgi:hypothetical protein
LQLHLMPQQLQTLDDLQACRQQACLAYADARRIHMCCKLHPCVFQKPCRMSFERENTSHHRAHFVLPKHFSNGGSQSKGPSACCTTGSEGCQQPGQCCRISSLFTTHLALLRHVKEGTFKLLDSFTRLVVILLFVI